MFDAELTKRINLLEKTKVEQNNKTIDIQETDSSGKGIVKLSVKNPCLSFKKMDKNCLGYFKCKNTADGLVFEYKDGTWYTHIFELKSNLSSDDFKKACRQLSYSFLNALAIAGFLDIRITIENTQFYLAYSKDYVNTIHSVNTVTTRLDMRNKETRKDDKIILDCWKKSIVYFPEFTDKTFKLNKLQFPSGSNERSFSMQL